MEHDQDLSLGDDQSLAERIVRGAIRAYRLHAFDRVDAEFVAEVVGIEPATVHRIFPTWEALLLVTLDRWTELRGSRRAAPAKCTIDHVRMTLAEDVADPGLVRVLAGAVTVAAGDSEFAERFRTRFESYVEQLTVGLQRDVDAGSEQLAIPAYQAATQLLAMYEGLQIQTLVRPHIDVLVEFDRTVGTLRRGWREREVPAWDLDEVVLTS